MVQMTGDCVWYQFLVWDSGEDCAMFYFGLSKKNLQALITTSVMMSGVIPMSLVGWAARAFPRLLGLIVIHVGLCHFCS